MKNDYANQIISFFKKHMITKIGAILSLFPERSRSSIFRDLQQLGYLTSYNHAGGYYTISGIPSFDNDGLWKYKGAYFSENGSLKSTVKYLVDNSQGGHTHDELREKLGVRVQNTLLDLVATESVVREKYTGAYVYFNTDYKTRVKQVENRKDISYIRYNPYITISVLRAVIDHPELKAQSIKSILTKQGINISLGQVDAVFSAYSLGKKNSL